MVCTYFLLANIVVFGFGRKIKHVMRQTCLNKKWNWRQNTIFTFFCLFGKAGLVYIQKSEEQFLMGSKICCRFSFGSYTFNLPNCSELKKKIVSVETLLLSLHLRNDLLRWVELTEHKLFFTSNDRGGNFRNWLEREVPDSDGCI